MRHPLKKLVLNLVLLGILVISLPGWHAGETVASANARSLANGSNAGAYDTGSLSSITTTTAFKSAFTLYRRAAVTVTFTNAGPALTMVFSLTALPINWTGGIYDTGGNPIPGTGVSVPQNGSFTVLVTATAGPGIGEGDSITAVLTASQQGNNANSAAVNLQFAVPSSFVYVMSDTNKYLRMSYLAPDARMDVSEPLTSGGNNLAVSAALLNNKKYILGYENLIEADISQNVEFSIFNNVGSVLVDRRKPFDNQFSSIMDSKPALAASPSGKFGMAFFRKIVSPGPSYSVMFQLFNEDGSKASASPVQVFPDSSPMDNLSLVGLPKTDVSPKTMVAVWVDHLGNVWGAKLNAEVGTLIGSPVQLVGTSNAIAPITTPLNDNRTFFAYSQENTNTIRVNDFDSNLLIEAGTGITLTGITPVTGDAVQFSNGNILFAYLDQTQGGKFTIKYTLFDNSVNLQLINPSAEFVIPNGLVPANVSVALDHFGRAMIFWTDAGTSRYLFYALIDSTGTLLTDPMIFREAELNNSFNISPTGQGIVGLDGLQAVFLPVISR